MGVKVLRPSGRKDWYIQVCEAGQRYLRHVGTREAAYDRTMKMDGTECEPDANSGVVGAVGNA
jgi:hypothetical protein